MHRPQCSRTQTQEHLHATSTQNQNQTTIDKTAPHTHAYNTQHLHAQAAALSNSETRRSARKLSLSLDLLCIKSAQHSPSTVSLRYSVPSLGYTPPIITGVCEVPRHGDALVPLGYSDFVFEGTYDVMAQAVAEHPVQVCQICVCVCVCVCV
jgi:hypothetical protein